MNTAVDPVEMSRFYSEAAKEASCPTCRTVNMLGMMCAAAMRSGGIFAFVGKGHGSDWPNPWERGQLEGAPGAELISVPAVSPTAPLNRPR